jgi:Flp pilus assembly secretin CpaC
MSTKRRVIAFAFALLSAGSTALPSLAVAADGAVVSVRVNMARILRISAPASTVVIGNPGVADVTIQDPQTLVLTGKSYGQTNLIVLDSMGNAIADTIVEVVQAQNDVVTVYMGSARQTLACAPTCQPTITLGDDAGFAASSAAASQTVSAMARGN